MLLEKRVIVTVEADTMVVVETALVGDEVLISVAERVSMTGLPPEVVDSGVGDGGWDPQAPMPV
jgi:hypothetical protein